MSQNEHIRLTLGLDIGPNSIGWALLKNQNGTQTCIEAAGVRAFEAGLAELEIDGKGKSRNAERREARGRRRLLERRARRLAKLANYLKKLGLLPPAKYNDPLERHETFKKLDERLGSPYLLRASALDKKLEPVELGRAIFHLAQRRGFKSNRKSAPKENEKLGEVKRGISELQNAMTANNARTLGEYFATVEPTKKGIRRQYIGRDMVEKEFNLIIQRQSEFYPEVLDEKNCKVLFKTIFHQRPIKSAMKLVGKCELEPKKKRAPWAYDAAQRFRYLQKVNDLRILEGGTEKTLTPEQRTLVIEKLESEGDLKFATLRQLLGLNRHTKFNLEKGGEKKIPGNHTGSKLMPIFGEKRWKGMSEAEKDAIVTDWRATIKDEVLRKHGIEKWGLDPEAAQRFAELSLQPGYCNFSLKAIRKLLPKLESGMHLQSAIKDCYPQRWERKGEALPLLPPVDKSGLSALANPIVHRSLSELRRVVNAVIARYGKPDMVRIELARDLKQNADDRAETTRKMRENQKARERAAEEIIKKTPISQPSRQDTLKYLLAEESEWTCPYTGKKITMASLFGSNPQFDIEHIIPFDRCLDDSYMNKTLCEVTENRKKGKRTPYEAYHGTPVWDEIIKRVKEFKGSARGPKLRRFQMTTDEVSKLLDDFTSRQLNDTRWAARWAKQYLGLLYGGIEDNGIDAAGKLRVQAIPGATTAFLRNEWNLNSILGDGPGKSRDDHRHHLIDAVIVALTDSGIVKGLSDAAGRAGVVGRRLFEKLSLPWENFVQDVRETVGKTVVSHRVSHRVRGALHKETFYGKPRTDDNGKTYVHIRVPLDGLSVADVEDIVDKRVREAVKAKLAKLGGEPKTAFKSRENHPVIIAGDGKAIPVHRVRIRMNQETLSVGEDFRRRYPASAGTHHMEVVELKSKKKDKLQTIWEGYVVSMYEAYRRLRANEPIICRDHGEGRKYIFSASPGDTIEIDDGKGGRKLVRLRTVPQSKQVRWVEINDARPLTKIPKTGQTAMPDGLRKLHCRKVSVSPLGEVLYDGI